MGVHTPTHKIILFIMEWKVSTKEKTMQLLCMNKVILKYLLEQCWLTSWGILRAFYSVLRRRRVVYVWLTWFLFFKNYVNRNIVAEIIKTSLDKQDMQFLSKISRFLAQTDRNKNKCHRFFYLLVNKQHCLMEVTFGTFLFTSFITDLEK